MTLLSEVTIERLPYGEVIRRYDAPETLFYLDPPYVVCEGDYGDGFAPADFERMADQLAGIAGRFVLSINDIPLVREPANPHDPLAVAIVSARGVRVGYLRRERAGWIGSKINRGYRVLAIVERIRGVGLLGASLGIVLRINMDGEAPELPDDPDRVVDRRAA